MVALRRDFRAIRGDAEGDLVGAERHIRSLVWNLRLITSNNRGRCLGHEEVTVADHVFCCEQFASFLVDGFRRPQERRPSEGVRGGEVIAQRRE